MIVTVTGANGFIGRHLVDDQLARGRKVRAVDVVVSRLQDLARHPSVELVRADIRDIDVMRRAVMGSEVVFHLASAHLSLSLSEDEYWKINVHGSRQLVELSHLAGAKRFVHCSSVGVHGAVKNPPANEESPCHPDLVYERTKLEGENAIRQYAQQTGYPVVVVRPVWVYGPGCQRTEKLFRTIKKGRFFFVGESTALRHCVYIADMVEAFHLCAVRPNAAGKVFIIGDEMAVSVRDLIQQMAHTAGAAVPHLTLPLWLARAMCATLERIFSLMGKEPPISERSLKFFTNNTSFDISRAKRELGFSPKFTLKEGLRLTYEAMSSR